MRCNLAESVKHSIFEQWSFLSEATFASIPSGSSQAIYRVQTPENRFILKFYAPNVNINRVRYEHSLLRFLESALPFAIPVPLAAACGDTFVTVKDKERSLYVTLLPYLNGTQMDRRNLKQVESAGFALAVLHDRLANFDPHGTLAKLPFWGTLDRIHPQITEPLKLPEILGLERSERQLFSDLLTEAMAIAPNLYATLPIQSIHADYITPNILVEGDCVTGIIDFEFATRDLRLLDYFSSLDQFASFPWKEDLFSQIVQAFSKGYRSAGALSAEEMEAAISVWKLQRASSLVYWTGWLVEGKSQRQQIVNAVVETLRFETWLKSNESRFFEYLGFAE